MTRRKQHCPKRMKWEGGEEVPEDGGEKLDGDDDRSITPNSVGSPIDEDGRSPTPGDAPTTPNSYRSNEDPNRDLSNSRCNSRDSAMSPPRLSPESLMSERAALLRGGPLGATALSSVGVTLPPTLPAAAAAALLPPQSAAMAAYLNAAAAAVAQQSHRLMMTSPLPPAFNRSMAGSPPGGMMYDRMSSPPSNPDMTAAILDFSRRAAAAPKHLSDVDSDSDVVNLSKSGSPPLTNEGALDLSCTSRKRSSEDHSAQPPSRKSKSEFKPSIPPWPAALGPSQLPYFAAAVAAASISPKNNNSDLWNGKLKHPGSVPSEASKALEKMSELSKLGGGDEMFRNTAPPQNSTSNRHSAWQSHWLNKGAEQAKDVLKCVWCKQSFPSLAAMTTHMKEAKHCGVNVPVPPMQSNLMPQPQITSPSNTNTSTSSTSSNKPNQNDLNMLIKETMPLPRKLVRGQDVWLGKGAEQTRQILKCMWCGQSFRSLAEMTSHMQQTQHYTNIISQEQIISWRSLDDTKGGSGNPTGTSGPNQQPPGGTSSHVSAVLTCKVCDQAFSSLKELSNHMVKNSHYKEHIMRSITESGGRRRQTREKRKKSLPVRKLLELERAQHDFKNGDTLSILDKMRDASGAGRITCEKCNNKIETSQFVDHIRQCVGGLANNRNFLKSALMSNNILPPESPTTREKNKTPLSNEKSPNASPKARSPDKGESTSAGENNNGSPSVLNAIEKLIEKSFDSRTRQSNHGSYSSHQTNPHTPIGSSILKRLGIDESVDYTKPLVDAQTMSLLRSYQTQQYGRRERSGSESSSISERGSSTRNDALSPERKMDPPLTSSTPRSTPDSKRLELERNESDNEVVVKKEIDDEESNHVERPISVKKELVDNDDSPTHVKEEEPSAVVVKSERNSPSRNSAPSPASSDRSGTPRSTHEDGTSGRKPGGSLGALSSMFDSLSGASGDGSAAQTPGKKGSSHPLAALQKLCDKTENHTNNRANNANNSNSTVTSTQSTSSTTPGAILAFSWACNDAVMTSDSIMKCAFCDTPFISKGAYRHHLSKMHFVKDGVIPDPVALKSNTAQQMNHSVSPNTNNSSASSAAGVPLKSTASSHAVSSSGASSSQGAKSPPVVPAGGFEESHHSKFLKYTELAKQLSSKYV